ncbi:MAG: hypothetical protein AABX44_01020 [Nanoarchaeota archaeon]
MGLFKKKAVKKEFEDLPELPKLPSLPEESNFEQPLPRLPRYSANSLNDEFSQNTIKNEQKTGNFLTNSTRNQIKEAISGKKDGMMGADEFVREQMMPEDFKIKPNNKLEFPYKMEKPSKELELRNWREPKIEKSGQIFVKIDKFEESLKIFELTKDKITEMEKLLEDIKELKEKEEKELYYWMAEIQTIKNQTEKVERDIFSKIE